MIPPKSRTVARFFVVTCPIHPHAGGHSQCSKTREKSHPDPKEGGPLNWYVDVSTIFIENPKENTLKNPLRTNK